MSWIPASSQPSSTHNRSFAQPVPAKKKLALSGGWCCDERLVRDRGKRRRGERSMGAVLVGSGRVLSAVVRPLPALGRSDQGRRSASAEIPLFASGVVGVVVVMAESGTTPSDAVQSNPAQPRPRPVGEIRVPRARKAIQSGRLVRGDADDEALRAVVRWFNRLDSSDQSHEMDERNRQTHESNDAAWLVRIRFRTGSRYDGSDTNPQMDARIRDVPGTFLQSLGSRGRRANRQASGLVGPARRLPLITLGTWGRIGLEPLRAKRRLEAPRARLGVTMPMVDNMPGDVCGAAATHVVAGQTLAR
ncbi:family 5 extracellular solute-binding protein [Marssonina coronariae]|uniref:Family 5 extracellular solute-binding protein n=1 Tax=Diplocarpon coronariae TaxID=2795749 RepID=A0A218YVA3_9HELO|nr:family 5 extracellular solute-binding protein [Marssonina coronariae]